MEVLSTSGTLSYQEYIPDKEHQHLISYVAIPFPNSFPDECPPKPLAPKETHVALVELVVVVTFLFYLTSMSIHTPVRKRGVYFITFTCFNWLPLIEITNGYDLVYNFFDVLKQNKNNILGYVVMPNHVHLLLHYTNTKQSLNTIIGNGKRFIGYDIVERLRQKNEMLLLNQMKEAVKAKDRERNKKHEVWKGTFDIKQCRTEKFILQKLIYIHNNPCTERWRLAEKPYQYQHSSARFYDGDKTGYRVKDYLDVLAELKYGDE